MHCCISYAISRAKKGQTPCDYLTPIPRKKPWASCAMAWQPSATRRRWHYWKKPSPRRVMTRVMPSSLKRLCCGDPPSRSASASAALATTSNAPETHRPITRTTMPSTALIVRSTPSCLRLLTPTLLTPTHAKITNNEPSIAQSHAAHVSTRSPGSSNQDHQVPHHDPDIPTQPTRPPHRRWPFAF